MVPFIEPLLRPDDYFDRNAPGLSLARAGAVALLIAVLATASLGALGYALAERADAAGATVTVDNEQRPPDWICENREDHDSALTDGCDEPRTREVQASALIWEAFGERLPLAFLGVIGGWLLGGVGLHVITALADGEGSFADSLAVAGWAQAATLPHLIATTVVLLSLVGTFDFAGGEAALERQISAFRSGLNHPAIYLGAVLATAWQGYVYYHGMRHARAVGRDAAFLTAVVVGIVYFLSTIP